MQQQLDKGITLETTLPDGFGTMENFSIANPGKPTAVINNWFEQSNRLWGQISKHPTQQEFKANMQMTSLLVELNLEEGYAETENTYYTLGTPYFMRNRECTDDQD